MTATSKRWDYVSPNLKSIRPDAAFPFMTLGDPRDCGWSYLRVDIPHAWYVDKRSPHVGFVSRDEASLLYNIALIFAGKPALEIGCWLGWSTCHLALGGVELDVIDPILFQDQPREAVAASLRAADVLRRVRLVGGYTPGAVHELAQRRARKWSLIFIDGEHEDPGPIQDAIACEQWAESDAMIIFHDLVSPAVGRGLDYFASRGWKTLVYNTMQIMGVAYRGNITPLEHHPDPAVNWILPDHLKKHEVSA